MMCRAGRRIALTLLAGLGVGSAAQALTVGVLDRSQAVMEARFEPLADHLATLRNGLPVDLKVPDADRPQHAPTYHPIDLFLPNSSPHPQWPVVALPWLDDNTVRRVTAAPLTDDLPVESPAPIWRLAPYQHMPMLTWREVWEQRPGTAILAGLSVLLVLALLAQIVVRNRRLTRSEAAVNDALAEQQAILTATPYPIFEVDATGRVLRSWAPSVRTTTIAPERMVGRRISEILPPDANDTLMRALHEASAHGQAQGYQFSLPTADGDRWFEASIGLIAGSTRPQRFAVLARNITTQRANEQWLKVAASVFTHAGEGILISDPDGRVVATNQALRRIMGYPDSEDLVGRYTQDLRLDYLAGESFISLRQSLAQTGSWHGELRGQRDCGELYWATLNINVARDEAGQISHYVAVLTDVTELKMQQDQLEHVAYHDALTNLPNRTLLADRLQQAMARAGRRNERVAVVYVDLDGFKTVNDGYGHDQGDALLIAVAQRMRGVLREGDTLARIGGDEFVAVLADLLADVDATPLLERLLTAANEPVQLAATELRVSASLGVTFYPQPGHSVEADQLLRQADQALYQAKLAGKNRYQTYDPAQDQAVKSRHERLQEIRHALQRDQFALYYQPKVNLRSGRVTGAEALIRWQHPQRGLLAPAVFLPVIENHPLGIELGEWVIESALRQIELWRQAGLDLPVSVNISANHLQQPAFTASLVALLAAHPSVAPSALEIEVLETSALADLEQVSEVMRACRDVGVNFALDDFGAGYSSLLYLKHLPATTLKIDQGFVRSMFDDADNLAILEGVLTLSRGFSRVAIAEGVETVEHGTVLLQLGCEFGQGYGIARPMPATDIPGWIATWQRPAEWQNASRVGHDRLPLLIGDVEHRAWIRDIDTWLQGMRPAPPTVAANAGRFDRWLDTGGRVRHGASPAFRAVERLHAQMHDLADELLALHTRGRGAEALARVPELYALNAGMRAQFDGFSIADNDGEASPIAGLTSAAGFGQPSP